MFLYFVLDDTVYEHTVVGLAKGLHTKLCATFDNWTPSSLVLDIKRRKKEEMIVCDVLNENIISFKSNNIGM